MINNSDFSHTTNWLLQSQTPTIRYLTMRDLLDIPDTDDEASLTRQAIALEPPVNGILRVQRPEGFWEQARSVYSPKYRSSHWTLLLLCELGVDPAHEQMQKAAEYMLGIGKRNPPWYFMRQEAGFGCFWGNWLRCQLYCSDGEDLRVQEVIDFVCADLQQHGKCRYNSGLPCAWAVTRDLFGLALIAEGKRSAQIQNAIETGIQFLLDDYDLLKADYPTVGKPHELWSKLSFPLYYQTDILFVLRTLKELNSLSRKNAQPALDWLRSKQHKDGTWQGGSPFESRSRKFMAVPDEIDRWITLQALTVLR